jgi:hypothetical protein
MVGIIVLVVILLVAAFVAYGVLGMYAALIWDHIKESRIRHQFNRPSGPKVAELERLIGPLDTQAALELHNWTADDAVRYWETHRSPRVYPE